MADVDIVCHDCKTVVTVSEFVDTASVVCRKCGAKLQLPEIIAQRPKPTIRTLKKETDEPVPETPAQEWRFHKHVHNEELTGQSAVFTTHHIGSWIVFVVLGGVMGWLRYGKVMDSGQMAMMREYGPFILLALHIVIVLAAFKHSIFHGILSVLIPPYPYYFLFALSDEFYLRAVVGGFLVGIGQDSFTYIRQGAVVLYNVVTHWIASGG